MAKKTKKSTLSKMGTAVKDAAQTVADKADEYVVKPVSKALGVTGKKKPATKTAAKKTSTAKASKSAATTKAAPAKKTATKRPARGK